MGQSPSSENYTENPNDYILVQGNADMKNGKVIPRVWTTQVTKIADKNDLILSVRAPVGDIGKTDYDIVLGRGVAAIKGNEFIFQTLIRMKENGFWTKLSTGSTFESINSSDIKEARILIPKKEEQTRIGLFFKKIDQTIATLQQRKLELLKKLKRGYLQQMFPAKDEVIPQLRFSDFYENWKLQKLGDIAKSFSGGTPSVGNKEYYNGKIPFIRSAEINKKETELFLTENGLANSSAKLVSQGTILYALYGATSGEVGISHINGAINQAILAIMPSDGYSTLFIVQWLRNNKKKITDKYIQGGQGNLSGAIIKDLQIEFPSKKEQKLVGEFFNKLDQNIALQHSKIGQLNKLKQAYLQKLFP